MFRNPLYYFPIEANILYYAEKGSKEYKWAVRTISFFISAKAFAGKDEKADKINVRLNRLIVVGFILALIDFGLFAAMMFADKISDTVFALLFCGGMLFTGILIGLCLYVTGLRKKLILLFLESYKPVCEDLDSDTLGKIGVCLHGSLIDKDDIEIGSYERDADEGDVEFDSCTCVSCMQRTENKDITKYDKHGNAICPSCGNAALVITPEEPSEFLDLLHRYYSEASK